MSNMAARYESYIEQVSDIEKKMSEITLKMFRGQANEDDIARYNELASLRVHLMDPNSDRLRKSMGDLRRRVS